MTQATIKMMSLNTWGFGWPLARDRGPRFMRIGAHLRRSDYDVVLFQELWGGAKEGLRGDGMGWVGAPTDRDSGLGAKVRQALGLHAGRRAAATEVEGQAHAELSQKGHRGPVERVKGMMRHFRRASGLDRLKAKGIQSFSIDTPCGEVCFINTHLQAGERHDRTRRAQLDEILEVADSIALPIVLAGDFNFFAHSHEDRAGVASLEDHGFRDASLVLDRPEATYLQANPYVGGHEDFRFDRLYLRDGVSDGTKVALSPKAMQVIVDHEAPFSDHEAIRAELLLTPS